MAYKIKISIKGIEPEIWRRLKIPGGITFQQFHQIIQASFGWLEYHLFKFDFPNIVITEPFDDYSPAELFGDDIVELDPEDTTIDKFLDEHDEFEYEYDFGDTWKHKIIVERKLKDTKRNSMPECMGGARERPPEDVGGISGYTDFVRIISDKSNPERQNMLDWAEKDTRGRIYDPEYFNKNEVNRRLYYALENNEFDALRLLTGEGLIGKVDWGWTDACIKTYGKTYTMQQIGNMLLRIGTDSIVTIKVEPFNLRKYR
ncbi:MAG: plasmid pRiA4b ORF-3 family protein [Actinomycetota bacterium]